MKYGTTLPTMWRGRSCPRTLTTTKHAIRRGRGSKNEGRNVSLRSIVGISRSRSASATRTDAIRTAGYSQLPAKIVKLAFSWKGGTVHGPSLIL
jgi:hypothetical protein